MAPKTTSTKRTAKPKTAAAPVEANVLDSFADLLVTRSRIVDRLANAANLATVLLGDVLASMYDAVDEDLPPVKADAPKAEQKARRDKIRSTVLDYVFAKTGHYYTWSSVSTYIDAARVNATLPESVRVTLDGEGEDANPTGTFGVWPLRALGRVEDEAVRASLAEKLAKAGITTQDGVEKAVAETNGETPEPRDPVAAAVMTDALVKSFRKREAATVGKIEHILLSVDEDDAAELADFGRLLWTATKADTAEADLDKRKRKRLEVFRAAVEQLLFSGEAAEDDGAEDGSEPVL